MIATETIEQYYHRLPQANPHELPANNTGHGHFNVFLRSICQQKTPYSRRDFYKISLILGTGKMHYADRWIAIDRPALVFSSPLIPYSWEPESENQQGWFCLFTQTFLQSHEYKELLQESPLFKTGGSPIIFINEKQKTDITAIFEKMMEEINSTYVYKYNLLRNYLHVILHEAMKIRPADSFEKPVNAAARITSLFLELLERQFPIDLPEHYLQLKAANDYAQRLSVHPNHLNRSVKAITGKTTTEHITTRIITEAYSLLKHTDWDIAQIAYSLGFDEPAYFTNFFKKHTSVTPSNSRQSLDAV